jgi:hypothetical protein
VSDERRSEEDVPAKKKKSKEAGTERTTKNLMRE